MSYRPVVSAITALALSAVVSHSAMPQGSASQFPTGAYVIVAQPGDPVPTSLQGGYVVAFEDYGVFRVRQDTTLVVFGAYLSDGDTLFIEDEGGPAACPNATMLRGAFRWAIRDGQLALMAVKDPCPSWQVLLVLRPLARKP